MTHQQFSLNFWALASPLRERLCKTLGFENVPTDDLTAIYLRYGYADKTHLAKILPEWWGAPAENFTQKGELLTPFDDYEVHGCATFTEATQDAGTWTEQVEDNEAEFFSLYGHIPGMGLECIGDFKTREAAEQIRWQIINQQLRKEALKHKG